ncbi:hypothetical protein [Streptomyces sp. NPDC001135]
MLHAPGTVLAAETMDSLPWAANGAVAAIYRSVTIAVIIWGVSVFRRTHKVPISLLTWLVCLAAPAPFYLLPLLGEPVIGRSGVGYGTLMSFTLTHWLMYRTSRRDVRREQWRRDAEARVASFSGSVLLMLIQIDRRDGQFGDRCGTRASATSGWP